MPVSQKKLECEWLQTNQLGSFAFGSVDRVPRRKYHTLLTLREPDIGESLNALIDIGETVHIGEKKFLLYAFNYGSETFPQGYKHLVDFNNTPKPTWTYRLDNIQIDRTVELHAYDDVVQIEYTFKGIKTPIKLELEPFLSYRPYHHLTEENPFLNGTIKKEKEGVSLHPYPGLPCFFMKVIGSTVNFAHNGHWNKKVCYSIEKERGYTASEDLFSPGKFKLEIKSDTKLVLLCGTKDTMPHSTSVTLTTKTSSFEERLNHAASQFAITTKNGFHTAIAGYPWFGSWSRDTLLSLPGLCFSTGRFLQGTQILGDFSTVLMKGQIPNIPSSSEQNQNTKLDTYLLYIWAVQNLEKYKGKKEIKPFMPAVYYILNQIKSNKDEQIQCTQEGEIFIKPGKAPMTWPMTWMDATINSQPVTPRFGYTVEINALFYNSLCFALEYAEENKHTDFIKTFGPLENKLRLQFNKRFWSDKFGYLADTHDGTYADFSLRPNQLWATALPYSPLREDMIKSILEKARKYLFTPVGLRTLSPLDPKYKKQYVGTQTERDQAYHQGTVWPWLLGIYAETVLKTEGVNALRKEITPVLRRLEQHLTEEGCLGQISEIFDAESPHYARGAPAQAWSVAEVLRVNEMTVALDKDVKKTKLRRVGTEAKL
ncbi:MAG: glycogen debranching enzyme family protein [Deltaproteobacteria bacterium]|nr:glycogen debranching enzyme family protein [Deltaproteobacteria bacterium]